VNLGYHRSVAERAVKSVLDQVSSDASFEVLLRSSLQIISA
jgi:RuvA, C-terminal domain.